MRILIANYEFPPLGGGGSKASFELARALVRRGESVSVLTAGHPGAPRLEVIDGVTIHRVWSWRKGVHDCGVRGAATFLVAAAPRMRRLVRGGGVDVIHYFFGLPTGALALSSRSVGNVPYVVSLRGSDVPLYDPDNRKLRLLHRLSRPVSAKIWRQASNVFAVSRSLRELARRSCPDVDVGVIYNGIEHLDCARESYGVDARQGPVRITCVSRLIPRKGVEELIDAVATLRDLELELVVIGTGPREDHLRRMVAERGLADRVKLVGYCSADSVRRHNERSDVFVLPTHSEAFANVILEAMGAGLPVVATRVGGVPEAVVDGETGLLVEPRDPRALAAAIRTLAQSPPLRRKLGEAGRRRVRERFTWDAVASSYVDAYRRAVTCGALAAVEPASARSPRNRPAG